MTTPSPFTTARIRSDFLNFFRGKGHEIVPSAPLVPANDPTLLFTNSGMVQFKDVFLGAEKRANPRAADVQRCLRAGGKHNDLDSVGYTARHHTFFEMLGNWSFGDYFKKDAIAWAWELLTGVWGLPKDRLLVTVYHTDDEAYALWHEMVGIPAERIVRIGDNKGAPYASDNFWQMADTGPCGPCTEIFYDHGPEHSGGPPGSPDEDGDRYIEIWNLVFMQFDKQPDGTLVPLPAPCVDTGMGLERLAAVLQHVHSNYEIDLFDALIREASELTGTADLQNKSLRVIADHIRACSFLIVDGVLPSNEGRGYVLRRIIRRALRHGWMLGTREPFFHRLVGTLCGLMGEAYPELPARRELVERALLAEEERFAETLDAGMKIFDDVAARTGGKSIPGADAFRLYDTYGFPLDLTQDIARERGLQVDVAGFEAAMEKQRETARAAGKFGGGVQLPADLVARLQPTRFVGYDACQADGLAVLALLRDGRPVQAIEAGDEAIVILDRTPFYGESGGQVGDSGELDGLDTRFAVSDTQKLAGQFHGHVGRLEAGILKVGDTLSGAVDGGRRSSIVLNHSATHLLHGALRGLLGTHVAQKGSLVAPDRLRFDFSHFQPVTEGELGEIERRVNHEVRANHPVSIREMGMQEAMDAGAIALFGEKYGERVRVVAMGDSVELCGGTHVGGTGEIGLFKLVSEGGVSAGVRRIEALTGQAALDHVAAEERRLREAAGLVGGTTEELADRLRGLLERQKRLEREVEAYKAKAASGATADLAGMAVEVSGVKVLAARVEGLDAKALRDAMDRLRQQLGDAVIVLAGASGGRAALVAGVSGAAAGRIGAGELVAFVAGRIGGKGGGRPDMAQGGGEDGPGLQQVLAEVPSWTAAKLSPA
ncbi:alanine--tRNA ligase [Luteimonas kalidii]|uniref:Alanine--tRNA ligase n=1 Tax=Luteimonas kalidii TaxID=3042025 RepID=A0ABT6JTC0_9GAMM|nr:alanine--tRNA ligase [Luteimonas kalidii]MDH5833936.1 alanine--tRNA ligase [Luteimonas kalidii]